MLPAGAHSRHDFDELRDLLPHDVRTIALDWPGHGDSPADGDGYTAMRFADLAEAVVEQLAPDGAVVVGNSVGGFAAARLAIRRPELVRGLALLAAGGFDGRPPQARAFCAAMGRPAFLRAIYPGFSKRYLRPRTDADRQARAAAIATTRGEPGLGVVAGLWGSFSDREHDLLAEAAAIAAPTTLVWGRRDPVIPPRVGRRAAEAIPGARLVLLDTGHCAHVSDPAGVAEAIAPLLGEAAAERG